MDRERSKEGKEDMESRRGVNKEKIHGEQEWSKKEEDTWRAGVE